MEEKKVALLLSPQGQMPSSNDSCGEHEIEDNNMCLCVPSSDIGQPHLPLLVVSEDVDEAGSFPSSIPRSLFNPIKGKGLDAEKFFEHLNHNVVVRPTLENDTAVAKNHDQALSWPRVKNEKHRSTIFCSSKLLTLPNYYSGFLSTE